MNRWTSTSWSMPGRWPALAAFVVACGVVSPIVAQELTTDAERSYRELRKSSDRANQLLAERWYNLIRLQDWTDATGKFKTKAKYVEHDPDLKWVKLRVVQGSGEKRVIKDVQVLTEKLDAGGRSRVRQIAFLTDKISEAAAAEEAAPSDDDASGRADEFEEAYDGSGESRREFGAEMPQAPAVPAPIGDGAPLPAAFPPLPADANPLADLTGPGDAAVAHAGHHHAEHSSTAEGDAPDQPAPPPRLLDDQAWRTSYDAFLANLTAYRDRSGEWRVDFGELALLEQARQSALQDLPEGAGGTATEEGFANSVTNTLDAIGEFVWEATLVKHLSVGAIRSDWFDLPPLPEPLTINYRLDGQLGAGDWRRLKVGERVRFVGRFEGFRGRDGILVAIRFQDEQSADNASADPPDMPR